MARKIAYIIGGTICIGFITYVVIGVYLGLNVYKNDKKKADVIIVLGARSYKGQQYNPCLVARVKEGVTLLNNKYAGKIIFSGGTDREDGTNEAETMREIALEMKMPASAILLETKSASTFQNLLYTKSIMEENNYSSAIIVTEPFHSPRASLVATKLSINHSVSPAVTSPCWIKWGFLSRYFLREPFALLYYRITGKL